MGPGLASLVLGAAIFAFGYLTGSRDWAVALGLVGLLGGVAELVGRQYYPILTVAPWGIVHRKSLFARNLELPRDDVVSWFDTSTEVKIGVRGGETIVIRFSELHARDAPRLVEALRGCGYTYSSGYVEG